MCDADLEYSPAEIPTLLTPVIHGDANVVYGTRTFGSHNAYSYLYVLGNRAVTTAANMLFNCYISDLETCFKLIPTTLYRKLDIRESGFGMGARSPANCYAAASDPTKYQSATGPAPVKQAKSSPGATGSKPSGS
jgi:dolichol-phosphate hexosyltransferase